MQRSLHPLAVSVVALVGAACFALGSTPSTGPGPHGQDGVSRSGYIVASS